VGKGAKIFGTASQNKVDGMKIRDRIKVLGVGIAKFTYGSVTLFVEYNSRKLYDHYYLYDSRGDLIFHLSFNRLFP
jgi:hypothetical protein